MSTLAITRKTSNALITAAGFNLNYDDIEAVVNALTSDNLAADSVLAAALGSDVVRTDYGLIQHTDGSLYVDLSDTLPGLEITDGGLRAKVYGLASRTANGIDICRADDLLLSAAATTPTGWTDVSATYVDKFIRISATALSTGGADTHSHTLAEANLPAHTHTYTVGGDWVGTVTRASGGDAGAASGTPATSSVGSGTAFTGANVPAYMTTKMFKKD